MALLEKAGAKTPSAMATARRRSIIPINEKKDVMHLKKVGVGSTPACFQTVQLSSLPPEFSFENYAHANAPYFSKPTTSAFSNLKGSPVATVTEEVLNVI